MSLFFPCKRMLKNVDIVLQTSAPYNKFNNFCRTQVFAFILTDTCGDLQSGLQTVNESLGMKICSNFPHYTIGLRLKKSYY